MPDFPCDFLSLGSRIASWLPSFSVEVMHTTNILGITQASNSQLNAMVRLLGSFGPQPSCLCCGEKGAHVDREQKGKEVRAVLGCHMEVIF